jgi:2-amino-4-hydroxy-6-hydroxymethyldihydropteridine diphosphokinase
MAQQNTNGFPYVNCLISLGSNKAANNNAPKAVLDHCLDMLDRESVTIQSISQFYSTPAFPEGSGPDFVNAAASLSTSLSALHLLDLFHSIEAELGRTRTSRWEQRVIDIDLLAYGDSVLPDIGMYSYWVNLPLESQKKEAPSELILPHPRIADRPFVLVPLRDIAPNWTHPVSKKTVLGMLEVYSEAEIAEIKLLNDGI